MSQVRCQGKNILTLCGKRAKGAAMSPIVGTLCVFAGSLILSQTAHAQAHQVQSSVLLCDQNDPAAPEDDAALQFEDELLRLVNAVRAQGADCGAYGRFATARPLAMHPSLRCAARKHAQDMARRQYFSHHSPEGETPWRRIRQAGYGAYKFAAENIASGGNQPRQVLAQLMADDPHCANIMSAKFKHIGIGYEAGLERDGAYHHLMVQDFATPP